MRICNGELLCGEWCYILLTRIDLLILSGFMLIHISWVRLMTCLLQEIMHWPVSGFSGFLDTKVNDSVYCCWLVLIISMQLRAFAEGTPLFEVPGGGLQSHESFSKDVFSHPSPMSPCCRRKCLTLRENLKESTKMVICSTKLNILLLCIPLAIVAVIFKWRHVSIILCLIFSYNCSSSSQTLLFD